MTSTVAGMVNCYESFMHNPFTHIKNSMAEAGEANDSNAGLLFLATASADGQPSVRTLLLRKIEESRLLILYSKHHAKWHELDANPHFEVLLWYPSIGHQYRIRGRHQLADYSELLACWHEQPPSVKRVDMSYAGDFIPGWPIDRLAEFRERVNALPDEQVESAPPPEHVVAAWLAATHIERIVASPDRLHDREEFVWRDESWHSQKVIP